GKNRHATYFQVQLGEKIIAGTINRATVDGGRLTGGNLPELGESAKMVETDVVAGSRGPAEALQPPAIACGAKRVPVVERIPPALASGAEVIGRHARDDFGKEIAFAQAEQITVRPYVRRSEEHTSELQSR